MLQVPGGRTSAIKSLVGSGLCLHPQLTHGLTTPTPGRSWGVDPLLQLLLGRHGYALPSLLTAPGRAGLPHFTEEATEARRHNTLGEGTA